MTNEKVYTPGEVASAAIFIADYLKTSYSAKKHGGYNIYEDDRIRISRDTFVPNISVNIKIDGEQQTVYSAGYTNHRNPDVFHRGLWIGYMMGLLPAARDAKQKKEDEVQARKEAQREKNFTPIDDRAIFEDVVHD